MRLSGVDYMHPDIRENYVSLDGVIQTFIQMIDKSNRTPEPAMTSAAMIRSLTRDIQTTGSIGKN